LTDFGIVKAAEGTRMTKSGVMMGTPEYMSPEQIRGAAIDARADVYALGIVCYEMLAGRVPFQGDTARILYCHVQEPPPSLRLLNPRVPLAIEQVVGGALAKDPAQRYASAGEFAHALSAAVSGVPSDLPSRAPEPSTRYVPRKQSSAMLPVLAGVGGAIVLLLLILVIAINASKSSAPAVAVAPTGTPTVIATVVLAPVATAVPPTATPIPMSLMVSPTIMRPPTDTAIPTQPPTRTNTPSPTVTFTPVSTPTPSGPEGMVLVPAGVFWMGAAEDDPSAGADEKPGMYLETPAYWIDKFEVSVGQYKKCVDASRCDKPSNLWSAQNPNALFGNPNLAAVENYPIAFISLGNASQYCVWLGRRLPFEYEWEKAARGPYDARLWAWGSTWDGYKANAAQGKPGALAVASYSNPADPQSYGCSPFGVCNMVGNVREWVADFYQSNWYKDGYRDSPSGIVAKAKPNWNSTQQNVVRGGSYRSDAANARVSKRFAAKPGETFDDVGFRCAMDAK
ncbi:MAG: SUMF1/EgtB/PvdO family nonheme iron enzyme, partial [Chloroflexota bacterium]|nr:SUMF1/EgtB/PvdO family nonheme iron enzyme [Chloroflexota bacterium]